MTHTRGGAGTGRNGDDDLPPPLHPTPAEMMAQLIETQRSMGEVLRGPKPTSSALSRTSSTPSLLFLRKQKNHYSRMSG